MKRDELPVKTCVQCSGLFTPQYSTTQICCSLRCAASYAKNSRLAKVKAERESFKKRKEDVKRLSEFRSKAQDAFNKWVRQRDADLPCVSCGEMNPPMKPGGQWDAGHFLGRGAYPELAFEETNCWRQCKSCNGGSGKYSHKERTVSEKYEAELLRRIGPEKLAWLKGPHAPKKYTREDYLAIEATYKQKLKDLEKQREEA